MGIEVVTVNVGGMTYTAFLQATVRAAFNEAARSFSLEIAAELGSRGTNQIFKVFTPITIHANGDLLFTGYVDQKKPRLTATSAIISVFGRSNSEDLIDCSAKHETGYFENKDPMQIGNEVAKGIKARFVTDQQLEKIERYIVNPGETCFQLVEKMTRQQGMTVTGTADGNAMITKASSKRHAGGLYEGRNILTGSADQNGSNRHSEYIVRGQRPFGHGVDNLEIEAIVRDGSINRHRPIIIIQDEDTTKKRTQKRAKTRKDRAAGHSSKAQVETQGFRDDAGKLWEPGYLVWTESPYLDLAQDMLIETVTYQQSEQGSIATLSLTDPRAYDGEGGKGNKSGSEWSMGD